MDPKKPDYLAQQLGPSLSQLQQFEALNQMRVQQNQNLWPNQQYAPPTFPTIDSVQKRIETVKEQIKSASVLLKTLEDVHAVLVKHPDLERLVTTMARLGAL